MKQEQYRLITRILFLFAFLSLSFLPVAAQSGAPEIEYRKGELIVEVRPGVSIETINGRWETTTIQQIYGTNLYRLRTPRGKKEAKWRKRLANNEPDLLSVALNPVLLNPITSFARAHLNFPDGHPTPAQTATSYTTQGLITQLQLVEAQNRAQGEGIIIAVVDTGVDKTHARIAAQLWRDSRAVKSDIASNGLDDDNDGLLDDASGWDFVDNDKEPWETAPTDPQTSVAGHGTFIAGIINLVAPKAVILPVRAFDGDGLSDAFTVAAAIKYAADHGAQIINLSFGSVENSVILREAIVYARQRGALLIAAVGNENDNTDTTPRFPAGWQEETIGVAAVDDAGVKAAFSNFGTKVAVSAPGVRVFSTFPGSGGGDYAMWSGTSFAAPFVAAEAALILERRSTADVRSVIENNSDSLDAANQAFSGKLGKGRINPMKALRSLEIAQSPALDHVEINLTSTGVESAARGQAEYKIETGEQEIEVEANGIRPGITYGVLINSAAGSFTASATANNFGGLKIEISNRSGSGHLTLPEVLTPVSSIKHVEVRNPQGSVILQGDFVPTTGGGTGGGGAGGGGQSLEKEIALSSTGVIPQAVGSAKIEDEAQHQRLKVEGDNLSAGAYTIVANGIQLGAAAASSPGYIKAEYRSDEGTLPQALQPVSNINHIEVRNAAGQVVLQGDFQSGSGGGSGGGGGSSTNFTAVIESLPSGGLLGDWRVGGRLVHVTGATSIDQSKGNVAVGKTVEVRGTAQTDGSVNASEIKVEDSSGGGGGDDGGGGGGGGSSSTEFTATIQSRPSAGFEGDWLIGGITVHVAASTEVDESHGSAVVGAKVEVRGTSRADGSVDATRIRVKQ
jgi:subtilisin family serine protease